jgi:hypothetical protein
MLGRSERPAFQDPGQAFSLVVKADFNAACYDIKYGKLSRPPIKYGAIGRALDFMVVDRRRSEIRSTIYGNKRSDRDGKAGRHEPKRPRPNPEEPQ